MHAGPAGANWPPMGYAPVALQKFTNLTSFSRIRQ
jgi:hypothetical protein